MKSIDAKSLLKMSELLKIFSDPTRLRIITSLRGAEKAVQDIAGELEMTISAISHQLKILRDANIVTNRRNGKNIYYRIVDDHIYLIYDQAFEHVNEE